MQLTANQRIAIKQMLSNLYNNFGVGQWDERVLTYFSDYGLPTVDNALTPNTYYMTLSELPLSIKRDIILRIFNAWCDICDYHRLSLFNAFTTLISLKICSGAEYLFMGAVVELLKYFGTDQLLGEGLISNQYFLEYGDEDDYIEFNLSDISGESFEIIISGSLINKITPFVNQPLPHQVQPLFDAIERKPFKNIVRKVAANAYINCTYSNYSHDKGLLRFTLTNIDFIDD